jgi:hypothetical protein
MIYDIFSVFLRVFLQTPYADKTNMTALGRVSAKNFSTFVVCILASFVASSAHAHVHHPRQGKEIFGYQRAFGPLGKLKISRPMLVWEVWPGTDSRISRFHVSVNGRLVNADYDPSGKRIWYRFEAPLAAGTYEVEADAAVDDELLLKKHWKFTVAEDATPELPQPGDIQMKAVSTVNQIRATLGLDGVMLEPSLCAAAQGHARYMKESGHVSHEETYAVKSYTGYSLDERLAAFGYVGGAAEDVGYLSKKNYADTIQALFDAPYHRIAFMQPGKPRLGTGIEDERVALDFEMNQVEGITVSPCDGQTAVPSEWNGFESPNPLRNHGGQARVGYPIIVAGFGPHPLHIASGSGSLSLNGSPVECYISAPDNDEHLNSAIMLIPAHPLAPGKYEASADFTLINGAKKSVHWTFTVGY